MFDPIKHSIKIEGNGYLENVTTEQKVYGEKIYLDKTSGFSSILGKKDKPVTFIIKQNK